MYKDMLFFSIKHTIKTITAVQLTQKHMVIFHKNNYN